MSPNFPAKPQMQMSHKAVNLNITRYYWSMLHKDLSRDEKNWKTP